MNETELASRHVCKNAKNAILRSLSLYILSSVKFTVASLDSDELLSVSLLYLRAMYIDMIMGITWLTSCMERKGSIPHRGASPVCNLGNPNCIIKYSSMMAMREIPMPFLKGVRTMGGIFSDYQSILF